MWARNRDSIPKGFWKFDGSADPKWTQISRAVRAAFMSLILDGFLMVDIKSANRKGSLQLGPRS